MIFRLEDAELKPLTYERMMIYHNREIINTAERFDDEIEDATDEDDYEAK